MEDRVQQFYCTRTRVTITIATTIELGIEMLSHKGLGEDDRDEGEEFVVISENQFKFMLEHSTTNKENLTWCSLIWKQRTTMSNKIFYEDV